MQTVAPIWQVEKSTTVKWYVRLFPSLSDVAFLLPIVALFAKMGGTQQLFADGDTGWHIQTGEWILNHHKVPTTDLFSFTRPDQQWFAWEWAWDVLFATVHRVAGLSGVGFANTLLLGLIILLAYKLAVRVSENNLTSMAVTAVVAAVSSIHWLARPHLFSWLFTVIFLGVLEFARNGDTKKLLTLPILMIFWVNLHGGFIAGLIVLGCYAVGEALSCLAENGSRGINEKLRGAWERSMPYWQSLGLCAVATLFNPYKWQLHQHIIAYLTNSELLDKIQEFQSISFHAGPAVFFELMLLLGAFAALAKLRQLQFTPVLLICTWAHFALVSGRHIPIFALVAAPFVAAFLSDAINRARKIEIFADAAGVIADIGKDLRAIELTPRLHLASAIALIALAGLFALAQTPFKPEFNSETFPVTALPVLRAHAGWRVFTTDQWADYLLYQMYPQERVFFDGRSDFYGNDFIKVNQRINAAEHDWKSLLENYGITLVVMKPETPLAAVLKLTAGSNVLFDDGKVIVFDTSKIHNAASGEAKAVGYTTGNSPVLQSADTGIAPNSNHKSKSQKGNHHDQIDVA